MADHSVERIRKTVIELDENGNETGVTFDSQKDAQRYYRCNVVTLRKHIKNKTKLYGHNVYLKFGDISLRVIPLIECDKDGISNETSLRFESMTDACRYYKFGYYVIKRAIDNRIEIEGFNTYLKIDRGEHEQGKDNGERELSTSLPTDSD